MHGKIIRSRLQFKIVNSHKQITLLFLLLIISTTMEFENFVQYDVDGGDDDSDIQCQTCNGCSCTVVDYTPKFKYCKCPDCQCPNPGVDPKRSSTKFPLLTQDTTRTKDLTSEQTAPDSSVSDSSRTLTHRTGEYLSMTTRQFTAVKQWELSFKIRGTYNRQLGTNNTKEHENLTRVILKPLKTSCHEVLGSSFVDISGPLRFKNGSILVLSTIDLLDRNPNVSNAELWERSLRSTLPGIFIENSTLITELNATFTVPTTPSSSPQAGAAVIVGVVCGVAAAFALLAFSLIFVLCRRRLKAPDRQTESPKDHVVGQSQLSMTLPGGERVMTWRESHGTTSMSGSLKSIYKERNKEIDDDGNGHASLHRNGAGRISFGNDFRARDHPGHPSGPRDFHLYRDPTGGLPRIVLTPQDEFGTMTTSSTDKSLKVVLTNTGVKSGPQLLQRSGVDIPPADFGGLFVPESSSDVGRTSSSFGLRLNRLNASRHNGVELEDIDLSSLSNAGDLYSLKPSNSDASLTNIIKVPLPMSVKKFITKDHDAKLHRDFPEGKHLPVEVKSH